MYRQFPFSNFFNTLFPPGSYSPIQPPFHGGPFLPPPSFPGPFPSPVSPIVPPSVPPGQAPTTPPPSFTPSRPQFSIAAVDPGGISGCLFKFTYILLTNNQAFWAYPIFVGPRSISGFRWTGYSWVYFGIDLNLIDYFQCY
jgi:hypothetical protein